MRGLGAKRTLLLINDRPLPPPPPCAARRLRTTLAYNNWDFAHHWRHIGSVDAEANEASGRFEAFCSIDAHNDIDLVAARQYDDALRIQASVDNAFNDTVFSEGPPIIGDDAGATAFTGANTFASLYDVPGRVYTVGVTASF